MEVIEGEYEFRNARKRDRRENLTLALVLGDGIVKRMRRIV